MNLSFRQTLIAFVLIAEVLVVSAEIYLRTVYYQPDLRVFPTGQNTMNRDTIEDIPLKGVAHFTTNQLGLRGPELDESYDKKILVLGSSTTVGVFLDDRETWPYFLSEKLKDAGVNAWVGVGSLIGNRYDQNHIQLAHFLETLENIDLVIVMGGGVDLIVKLASGEYFWPNTFGSAAELELSREEAFSWKAGPFSLKNPAIIHFLTTKTPPPAKNEMMIPDDYFVTVRSYRANGEKTDKLPDFTLDLEALDYHVGGMSQLAKNKNVPLLFLTQPNIWDENISKEAEASLWMGFSGTTYQTFPWGEKFKKYFTISSLSQATRQFREREIAAVEANDSYLLDIFKLIPPKSKYFIDDVHLTPDGSELVAQSVFEYIQKEKILQQ